MDCWFKIVRSDFLSTFGCANFKSIMMEMNKKKLLSSIILLVILIAISSCRNEQGYKSDKGKALIFTTWDNICYDRAASIWLIHHFVDSSATFRFVEFGKKIDTAIPFDVPGAELGRQRNFSCFESIIRKYEISDPALLEMARIVHDIDVNIWGNKMYAMSDSLDKGFKKLRSVYEDEYKLLEVLDAEFYLLYEKIVTNQSTQVEYR